MKTSSCSLIKPHVVHVSGSGHLLPDVVVERNIESARREFTTCGVQTPRHVLVVPTGPVGATLYWTIDGQSRQAAFSGNEVILNPAGLFAAPRWSTDVDLVMLAIEPALLNRLASDTQPGRRIELAPRFHFVDLFLRSVALQLVSEFENEHAPNLRYCEALAQAAALHLARHYAADSLESVVGTTGLTRRELNIVKSHIETHLSDKLSVNTLARLIDISESHFTASFKQATGRPPHQYVVEQRLERARALLMQAELSIVDVAAQTGFADQSHLTRAMRRYAGQTPRRLRREASGAAGTP